MAELEVEKGATVDSELVELAALLHDVGDKKYSEISAAELIHRFLETVGFPKSRIDLIVAIVNGVSFQGEIGGAEIPQSIEFRIVQDADRLDAIGAVGIARCFTFGGARRRPMYADSDQSGTSIQHFYGTVSLIMSSSLSNPNIDKLFKLKSMMKTTSGREAAAKRHRFMEDFIREFSLECDGEA